MRVRFGEFLFDCAQRDLTRSGARVHISPKAVALLEALLSERPKVIPKADLQARVWPGVVVEEANLTNLVSELRSALDDDPRRPRYIRTAHSFGYAFVGDAVDELEPPARDAGREKTPHLFAGAALVTLVSLAVLVFLLRMRRPDPRPSGIPPRGMTAERLSIDSLGTAAVSPDRRFLAYSTLGLAHSSIRLRHLDTGAEFDLVPNDDANYLGHLKFSSDGNWLYYLRSERRTTAYDELRRIPILGGPPEVIVRLPEGLGAAYAVSPDASRIAFIRHGLARDPDSFTVVTANADGSNRRDLASFREPEGLCCSMSWSPDRTRLLLPFFPLEGQPRQPQFNLAIVDVASGSVQRVLPYSHLNAVMFADWTSDGSGFVAVTFDSTLHYFSFPDLRQSRIDAPHALYGGVFALPDATVLALAAKGESSVWTLDLDRPEAVNQITGGEATGDGWDGMTWTRDDQIVYSAEDLTTQSQSLRICDADGSHIRQLTRAPANIYHSYPAVSPDAKLIVFTEKHGNGQRLVSSRIVRMRVDGGEITPVSEPSRFPELAFFTDDGRTIVFTHDRGLMKVPVEGGTAVPFEPGSLRDCNARGVDPTGKWMACAGNGKEPGYVVAFDGEHLRPQKETSGVRFLRWTADGALSYVKGRPANIFVQPVDGKPAQVTNFGSGRILNFAWSPRGRKLAIAREWTVMQAYLLRNVPLPAQSR